MITRDIDIRNFLNSVILEKYKSDPDTKIISELDVCYGNARIDVAVINSIITGYEIKSDSDTLQRLPKQIELYSKVFDKINIVSGTVYINKILNLVPDWWGVIEIISDNIGITGYNEIRQPALNKSIDAYSLSQLLWKSESLELLGQYSLSKGLSNKTIKTIWIAISNNIPLENIQEFVRFKLKNRLNCRTVKPVRLSPKSFDYQKKNLDRLLSQITRSQYAKNQDYFC